MMAVDVLYRGRSAFLLSLIWSWAALTEAGIVNRTIDDGFGDSDNGNKVMFLPSTKVWEDQSCAECAIRPSTYSAFKKTYTAATYRPEMGSMSIEMEFEGLAVWVFFILANNAGDGITSLTMANFTLDGGDPTLFQHAPDLTTRNIGFNQLVYSRTGLVNAKHKLIISTFGVNTNVYVNFDYAIYTHDDDGALDPSPPPGGRPLSTSSTPTKTSTSTTGSTATGALPAPGSISNDNNTGATKSTSTAGIVGGIVGGVALLALLAFLFVCRMRRQRHKTRLDLTHNYWATETDLDPVVTPLRNPESDYASANAASNTPYLSNTRSQSYAYGGQHARQYSTPSYQQSTDSGLQFPPTNPQSEAGIHSAYEGYASVSGGSHSTGETSESTHARLVTVTDGDHLSNPTRSDWGAAMNPQEREGVRRERQRELDERMCHVQQEMNHLAADMTGQKPSRRRSITIRRPQAPSTAGEDEMSMEEMREQLRLMTNQVSYLRNQQQSAWALGLSDDPPPGYEPTNSSASYPSSAPLPPPPPHS